MNQPYSHRNGETEFPTVHGYYGVCSKDGYEVSILEVMDDVYWTMGSTEWYDKQHLIDKEVRFWGPITGPWDGQND